MGTHPHLPSILGLHQACHDAGRNGEPAVVGVGGCTGCAMMQEEMGNQPLWGWGMGAGF